ncbi:glycosyltransferase family 10 domain-containing protein [Tateyamaria sp. SN6-1]|uniref:glycosyltransferase family 10 domain-containing protein n=1 Tax=Tateyamaria sp. SN6-1 TaxID=3092148 RepID=UPI0039F569EF
MIKVFLSGAHARRTPLSYTALADLWDGVVMQVDQPDQADMHVFAHVLDIQMAPFELVEDWRVCRTPIVLLSEEPFWDTIWGQAPLDPVIYVDTQFGIVPVHQLNHTTSDIFRFEQIPYFLLTDARFANAYADRFARAVARGPVLWGAPPFDIGFMFERRPEPFHDVTWLEADLIGLAAWRTRLAEACDGDRVRRWGRSWEGGLSRFDLGGDWHVDKLARIDGQCRLFSAVENTHHRDYVTEKLFDALACGSVPLYVASPGHRLHEMGLPDGAWVNLFGHTAEDAARMLAPQEDRSEALYAGQLAMAQLFGETSVWQHERKRLRNAVLEALVALL